MKKSLYILTLLFFSVAAKAQQKPGLGWFEDVQLYYNPAYAGSGEGIRATALTRNQWSALSNESGVIPPTILFNAEMPLGKGIGGGIDFYKDQVGNFTDNNIGLNGSYRLYLNSKAILQMGIKASMSFVSLSNADAFQWDAGDPLKTDQTSSLKRIGFGALLKMPKFYIGLSSSDFKSMDSEGLLTDGEGIKSNFNIISGGKYEITEYFSLLPSTNIRFYGSQLNMIVNLGLEINQTVVVGASYSHPSALGIYGKVALSSKIKFGYRHEFRFFNLSEELNTLSSSEFLLTYGFN